MPNSAPGFASRPDYRVDLLPESRRVKVVFGGVTIADSGAALRVEETGHGPVYYVPEKDVRLDLMHPTEHHTRCPYKGEASYWTIELPARGGDGGPRTRYGPTPRPMTRSAGLAGLLCLLPEPGRFDHREPEGAHDMHLTQNWDIRKPGVSSRGGVVASQNGTAARVGAEVLAAGGTAVDAVVATAFALAAVEPWNSGLGGIGFMVVHPAGADRAEVVDFGPVAPHGLDPAAFPLTGEMRTELFTWPQVVGDRNMHGPLSFAIPSAVRGYALAVERFGRLPWRELVAPAIALAQDRLAGRLVHHGQGRQRRGRSAALSREPAGLAAGRSAAGLPARERQHDPAARASCRNLGAARRGRARGFLSRARSRDRSPPTRKPRAACCRPRIWRAAGRASCASARYPLSRRDVSNGAGDDRRADPRRHSRGGSPSGASAAPPTQIISRPWSKRFGRPMPSGSTAWAMSRRARAPRRPTLPRPIVKAASPR